MNERLEKLINSIMDSGLDCLVLTSVENIRYLSGFSGSSAVAVVAPGKNVLITDGRYREQAALQAPSWEIVIYKGDVVEAVAASLAGSRKVGFEETSAFGFYNRLRQVLGEGAALESASGLGESLRSVKDEGEISLIRRAVACAVEAFEHVLPMIRPGVSERRIAAELDYRMVLAGADSPAFETVVASGPNSSLPHANVTDRLLEEGDLVVIDFGAAKDGYCSDVTRTLALGEPEDMKLEILDAAVQALEAALGALEPGVAAREVDRAARARLDELGISGRFTHGVGHGVGLEVHEKPTLSERSEDTLEPGMVFTVEPGVYVDGWGGSRLEEMVLMTGEGPELLTGHISVAARGGQA